MSHVVWISSRNYIIRAPIQISLPEAILKVASWDLLVFVSLFCIITDSGVSSRTDFSVQLYNF